MSSEPLHLLRTLERLWSSGDLQKGCEGINTITTTTMSNDDDYNTTTTNDHDNYQGHDHYHGATTTITMSTN